MAKTFFNGKEVQGVQSGFFSQGEPNWRCVWVTHLDGTYEVWEQNEALTSGHAGVSPGHYRRPCTHISGLEEDYVVNNYVPRGLDAVFEWLEQH